jgi:O-antigen polymerase
MHIVLETPGGTGLYLSFNVFGWLIATLLISLGLWQITLNNKVVVSKLQLYSLLGFLCLCVPMFYGSEFSDHAIPRLLGLGGGLLLLFCLYQFEELKENPQQVLWWILIAVAIQACFGLVQYFFLETGDWGGYKEGISRPHGSFIQPNVMASFLATGIAICLYLGRSVQYSHYNLIKKGLIYFTLFTSSFLIFNLHSRTGYLAIISATLLLTPYLFTINKKQFFKLLLPIFSALLISQINIAGNSSDIFNKKVTNITARSDIYSVTAKMIIDKPLFGYGYGNFERSYLNFNNNLKIQSPSINKPLLNLSHPHNEVLFWVSEGGIITFLGMVLFFIAYMKCWLKISSKLAKRLAILGLITPLLLHSQLEFPFYSSISHWFVFIILLWFTDIQGESKILNCMIDKTFLLRFVAMLTSVIFVPFLVTTLHTGMIIVDHEKNGYQDLDSFKKIINPIAWQKQLDVNVYAYVLISGLKEKKPKNLEKYINWGLKEIKHRPRISLYSNTLLALQVLGNESRYQKLLLEAKKTYPRIKDWEKKTLD